VIRMPVEDVKRLGRSTQGVIVMRLRDGEIVSSLAPVIDSEPEGDGDEAPVATASVPSGAVEDTEDVLEPFEAESDEDVMAEDEPSEE